MKFEMETEPSPAGRPRNGRRNIVIIACTAIICVLLIIICVLLIIVYVKLECVNREDKGLGNEPGLGGPDVGHGGAPGAAGQPGESGLPDPTGPKGKTGPSGLAGPLGGVETSAEGIQNMTGSKGIVEGIIAGTSEGVVIIPFDSWAPRTISRQIKYFPRTTLKYTSIEGVAFNWQSRKVYWIDDTSDGIRIADLDGSNEELIVSETRMHGLAVDQITGNLYYGENSVIWPRIRVCDSMGNKCLTVASGVDNVGKDVFDIALYPSEGIMFWSSLFDGGVTRANMDGTNATVIISDEVGGLYVNEFTEKLYWANSGGHTILQSDLNGHNRKVLLNTTICPFDIGDDGETLYFGGWAPSDRKYTILDGVYSVASVSNGRVSSIANTTGYVRHIALFGRNKVSSRPNPCNNSPCENLCVLTRHSYTCL